VRLVAQFDESGLSRAAFARKHGLNAETLRKWRDTLRREREEEAEEAEEAEKALTGFVEVTAGAASVAAERSAIPCRVCLGAVTVELADVPAPGWLLEVAAMAAAEGLPC